MEFFGSSKKFASPSAKIAANMKTSITCVDMPEGLFDTETAKKHFGKFGKVSRILMRPKSCSCVIEYESPESAQKALLNAGAFDGFMFDVTWTKKKRKKSKVEDDPEWFPDSDVEEELLAMSSIPAPKTRLSDRIENDIPDEILKRKPEKKEIRTKTPRAIPTVVITQPPEQPVAVITTQTTMTTSEAAIELHQIRQRISRTPDEQRRTLEARDRILRVWGGTGARVKTGGATVGTCPDMCPEKERLQRQAEHQLFSFEADPDGNLSPHKSIKQYSRSSADQEAPMCYELRPPKVLKATANYLLTNIVPLCENTNVSLAEWFHFLWDRFRGIRKDITQQALCCAESVRLVEKCARFHAHCGARLVSLGSGDFDQRLNTDNLTKCLQTLKHMYSDLSDPKLKPFESEFRGYIALLNLNDTNFFWEIKRLPIEIQKSDPIIFAIQIFSAMDNNNYVRFFRLIKERATYLQACILHRYFNDVRARALARLVKAFAPKGDAKYPAQDLCSALAFENIDTLQLFVENYGLTVGEAEDGIVYVVLNRQHFVEDSEPFATERAVDLVESKLKVPLNEIIAGGKISDDNLLKSPHSSFDSNGMLTNTALLALDQDYDTRNDSNKNILELKTALEHISNDDSVRQTSSAKQSKAKQYETVDGKFAFAPAIPITKSPPKPFTDNTNHSFLFSKPASSPSNTVWSKTMDSKPNSIFAKVDSNDNVFSSNNENIFQRAKEEANVFRKAKDGSVFTKTDIPIEATKVFGSAASLSQKNIFASAKETKSVFGSITQTDTQTTLNKKETPFNVFNPSDPLQSIPSKPVSGLNIFGSKVGSQNKSDEEKSQSETFKMNSKSQENSNIFAKASSVFFGKKVNEQNEESVPKSIFSNKSNDVAFMQKADNVFGNVANESQLGDNKVKDSIFAMANPLLGNKIFGQSSQGEGEILIGQLPQEKERDEEQLRRQIEEQAREIQNNKILEELRKEEERKLREQTRLEEERKLEELKRQDELRRLAEKRKLEEEQRKQEELKKRLEEEKRKAEEKRLEDERRKAEEARKKAEEERKKFIENVIKESQELTDELIKELMDELTKNLMKEEKENFDNLLRLANEVTEEVISELCDEICEAETKAEKHLTRSLMDKFASIWRSCTARNIRRRRLVDRTPLWLCEHSLDQVAKRFKRDATADAVSYMRSYHRGYQFNGELSPTPPPKPYNLTDIIHSSIFKRFKELNYSFSDNVFWKISISSPGPKKYLRYDLEIDKWIRTVFAKDSNERDDLLYISKDSWNKLVQFAISVTLVNKARTASVVKGSNGVIVYGFENEKELLERLDNVINGKDSLDIFPLAVIMINNQSFNKDKLEEKLNNYIENDRITAFRIYVVDKSLELVDLNTKLALKWLARNLPEKPSLHVDMLKNFLHCTIGNEFWYRLRLERHTRIDEVFKDLQKICSLYNEAVEKVKAIVSEDIKDFCPNFSTELKQFLPPKPYPKTYEYFPDDWRCETNKALVENIIESFKMPKFKKKLRPNNYVEFHDDLKNMIVSLDWFENNEVAYQKMISVIPNEFSDSNLTCEEFLNYFGMYDFIDIFHMLTCEKINQIDDNILVVYERSSLENYRKEVWWQKANIVSPIKHKALELKEDATDLLLNASFSHRPKRLRFSNDFNETLEDEDVSLANVTMCELDSSLQKINDYQKTVNLLEKSLDAGSAKSLGLEQLLRHALDDL